MMTTTSQGWADLYAWRLERASGTPLSRQIYMQVRAAVLSGALRAGTRVPSSRVMAERLGVARASVVSMPALEPLAMLSSARMVRQCGVCLI